MRIMLVLGLTTAVAGCGALSGGSSASRSFALSNFDGVRLTGSDDVRVVQGAAFSVVATGQLKVLKQLDIRVEGSTLVVARAPQKGWRISWADTSADVTVTMPSIRSAQITGSGNMAVDRAVAAAFEAGLTGSGDLNIDKIEAGAATLRLTGSGDIRAAGQVPKLSLAVQGSGDIDARDLAAETVDVAVRGSGNVRSAARRSATISVAGSGDVQVSGTKDCTISQTGSGDASCTG